MAIGAKGVESLQRDLSAARRDLSRTIDETMADAGQRTAADARGRAQSLGSTAAHVAPSVRADGATVGLDGPAAAGAEFGGRGRPTTQQFQPYNADGYFLYPAIREQTEERLDENFGRPIEDMLKGHNLT